MQETQETWSGFLGWKDPLEEEKWQPTPVLLPEKSHGQRRLVDFSLWGSKESDVIEWLIQWGIQNNAEEEGKVQVKPHTTLNAHINQYEFYAPFNGMRLQVCRQVKINMRWEIGWNLGIGFKTNWTARSFITRRRWREMDFVDCGGKEQKIKNFI